MSKQISETLKGQRVVSDGVDPSANQIRARGRDQLVDNSMWRRLRVRSRSSGDEDGAHQGIVSLDCF